MCSPLAFRRTEPDSALNRKTPTSGLDGLPCVVSCHLLFSSLLQHEQTLTLHALASQWLPCVLSTLRDQTALRPPPKKTKTKQNKTGHFPGLIPSCTLSLTSCLSVKFYLFLMSVFRHHLCKISQLLFFSMDRFALFSDP